MTLRNLKTFSKYCIHVNYFKLIARSSNFFILLERLFIILSTMEIAYPLTCGLFWTYSVTVITFANRSFLRTTKSLNKFDFYLKLLSSISNCTQPHTFISRFFLLYCVKGAKMLRKKSPKKEAESCNDLKLSWKLKMTNRIKFSMNSNRFCHWIQFAPKNEKVRFHPLAGRITHNTCQNKLLRFQKS